MPRPQKSALALLLLATASLAHAASPDFPLATSTHTAQLIVDPSEAPVVHSATALLTQDIASVTGSKPADAQTPVYIGTLGKSPLLTRLAAEGKLDLKPLEGKWETYLITVALNPAPGIGRALIVAGSDPRGTAYGLVTLSQDIGVSPWTWWADVSPAKKDTLSITVASPRIDGPRVKYRGIFINDEDWGIHPWAAKNFEKDLGDIGPKTYDKVFELLLRLKANYCWPAMHDVTRAFNTYPDNKLMAEKWGIVMGSSHCEPLLRNNVDEWHRVAKGDWNWVTNKDEIIRYLKQRVDENGRFDNVWTVGMRGIHDSGMPGGGTETEKARRLEEVIAAQRDLLAPLANGDASKVPQAFIPYKETLALYDKGIKLPDDITIVWPDDNHGYIRRLSSPSEQTRTGGGGVYYHASYWGAPISYLWLDSTPPAQIWQEMTKAAAFKVDRLWVCNVGDIKSTEKAMTFFLNLAWNPEDPALADQSAWLTAFAKQNFGDTHASEIASLLSDYYHLCAIARPEHLARNIPNDPLTDPETIRTRLATCDDLYARAKTLEAQLPESQRDAYFELVLYPISGMTATNVKFLSARENARLAADAEPEANVWADRAKAAWNRVLADTAHYNNDIQQGKWKGMIDNRSYPAADKAKTSLNAPVLAAPAGSPPSTPAPAQPAPTPTHLTIASAQLKAGSTFTFHPLRGLGYDGSVALLQPRNAPDLSDPATAPTLTWTITPAHAGPAELVLNALPTQPPLASTKLRCAITINDGPPQWIEFKSDDEYGKLWSARVLLQRMSQSIPITLNEGPNTLRLHGTSPALIVDSIDLTTR